MNNRPSQPPEGKLIGDAAKERGLSLRVAARRAGISYGRWRQIVTGVQNVSSGVTAPVRGPARTVAKMAQVAGVEPEELDHAGRADAASELRKLRNRADTGAFTPSAAPFPAVAATISLETVQAIVRAELVSTATAICEHAKMVLARDKYATGADIFPGEPDLAGIWDSTPSLSIHERARYAAIMRLGRKDQPQSGCA